MSATDIILNNIRCDYWVRWKHSLNLSREREGCCVGKIVWCNVTLRACQVPWTSSLYANTATHTAGDVGPDVLSLNEERSLLKYKVHVKSVSVKVSWPSSGYIIGYHSQARNRTREKAHKRQQVKGQHFGNTAGSLNHWLTEWAAC